MSVTFDGITKLITIDSAVSEIDVQVDIYSNWVNWYLTGDNSKFLPAIRYIGGDPTVTGQSAGLIFFMTNGWKIYLDHSVDFVGAIYSDDYDHPFELPVDTFLARTIVSSLVTQTSSGGSLTKQYIAEAVLDALLTNHTEVGSVADTLRSIADVLDKVQKNTKLIPAIL